MRIIGGEQQIVRLDRDPEEKFDESLYPFYPSGYDVFIISDYGKGVVTQKDLYFLRESGNRFIVDPKPNNKDFRFDLGLLLASEKFKENFWAPFLILSCQNSRK